MSTRDELEAALISGFAIKNAVWVENDMPCLRLGEVADYLLSQGWRPPMRVIETVEELESVEFPAILEGSGTYVDGKTTFTNCQFRPRPEWSGGYPGLFETLVVGFVGAGYNLVEAKDIHLPIKVLWGPEGEA